MKRSSRFAVLDGRLRAVRCFVLMLVLLLASGTYSGIGIAVSRAASDGREPLHRFPRMVHEYFVDRVNRAERRIRRRLASLETASEARQYVKSVRERIQQSFGPWPEKTPLNPRITGTVQRDEYKIENIIFESRPGFLVTGNLYIPKGREFPLPGVVGTCGHSHNGKAATAYQSYAQGLARQGYVVLIYDPLGQGERLQYPDENLKSRIGVGVREHLYAGNQQFLVGEFIGAWRAWDGIRALDYLRTREEVDADTIGVTGNSGGGTMTTWLAGVERRWCMAAPSCFVTTFLHNMENELPADTEQCPPEALALGLDHADFLAAMAPKPVRILAKEQDFFDVRGSEEALRRLKHLYGLLGAEDNVSLFVGPGPHGYSQPNREAMYRLFNSVTGISDATEEPEIKLEEDKTLWCAPDGQVCRLDSRTVFDFTKEKSGKLTEKRPKSLSSQELKKRVVQVLGLRRLVREARSRTLQKVSEPWQKPDKMHGAHSDALSFLPPTPPDYRILQVWRSRGFPKRRWTTYAVETEPGIQAVAYRLSAQRFRGRPPGDKDTAILYVPHHSSDAELRNEPLIGQLLEGHPDAAFYTCDVRGIGESRPGTCNPSWLDPYGADFFYAIHSIMLDTPYPGQKTYDVLRTVQWLKSVGHEEIHLVGNRWGAIPATFAALLSKDVTRVTLKNSLSSYSDVAESEMYEWPLSCLLPDVLKHFDLPQCYEILEEKKNLKQIEPWGANGPLSEKDGADSE